MRKLKVKEIKYVRGKWADRDIEQGTKIPRKHLVVNVIFEDIDGNEMFWYPRYTELKDIFLLLEVLHGADEVFVHILGDGDMESYKRFMEEEGQ